MTPLFARLFDDAAIFPPGNARVPKALADHELHRTAWYAETLGPFVCSERRWPGLVDALPRAAGQPLEVTLVVAGGQHSVPAALAVALAEPRVAVRAVEVPVAIDDAADIDDALRLLGAVPPEIQVYVELQLGPGLDVGLAALHSGRFRGKFRTGGEDGHSAPDAGLLAEAIETSIMEDVPFKLTGGLHHAVAHRSPHGHMEWHGFLNLLVAVSLAQDGAPTGTVAGLLRDEDGDALVERVRTMTTAQVERVRAMFVSFGTCSISEPLADLRSLGMVAP